MPKEGHFINRSGWLRAAILGANDGIVSTASLLVGVLAAGMDRPAVLLTGLAGLTAGALSMAAGEYVSVSAQSDTEAADLARERQALEDDPEYELHELAEGLQSRGVSPELALQVAREMTEHDALDAHAREELGLTDLASANPLEAAGASALAFSIGAVLPLIGALVAVDGNGVPVIAVVTLLALVLLGGTGARLGGAPMGRGIARVLFWGSLAMTVTYLVGFLFDVAI
ncbi:VIT1/CCC1 transporter family protein [Thalassovita mangrovi]|uniref:VIT family protein n=1 Tax=Thalassovita mangrovi TaxID=2692236 RepID=A0A6L8LKK1_9RHOB|nr:VIT family protein [Thalassovita mangrovi]MYM56581.1 VIT family protein [Thalassovita mangrovi]